MPTSEELSKLLTMCREFPSPGPDGFGLIVQGFCGLLSGNQEDLAKECEVSMATIRHWATSASIPGRHVQTFAVEKITAHLLGLKKPGCPCTECLANPTEAQSQWANWVEEVFWPVSACLKHGGFFFEDLTEMELYGDLTLERSHELGGDELHCIREQIWVEYDIPAKHESLWPTKDFNQS